VESPHIPVLLDETVALFDDIDEEGWFVDCTLGYAGHSAAVLERHPKLRHIGIDRDDEALAFSRRRLASYGERSKLVKGSFSRVVPALEEKPVVGLLADFGVSSLQLDKKERGFAFDSQRLDMRMDTSAPLTAYDVVNGYDSEKLAYIFDTYGEVRGARKLAEAIVRERMKKPFESAAELSAFIAKVLPSKGKLHPATLPFQAIRIEVNDELGEIERLLDTLEKRHYEGEIVALITFHSLEDRLVKNRFKKWAKRCICPPHFPRCECGGDRALGDIVTKKPITASLEEIKTNPRSRSAKLRAFRFRKDGENA
jgi:16S rRNA (cytosine1402-N4)-methyltransferase